jgi:hypothetical protein
MTKRISRYVSANVRESKRRVAKRLPIGRPVGHGLSLTDKARGDRGAACPLVQFWSTSLEAEQWAERGSHLAVCAERSLWH